VHAHSALCALGAGGSHARAKRPPGPQRCRPLPPRTRSPARQRACVCGCACVRACVRAFACRLVDECRLALQACQQCCQTGACLLACPATSVLTRALACPASRRPPAAAKVLLLTCAAPHAGLDALVDPAVALVEDGAYSIVVRSTLRKLLLSPALPGADTALDSNLLKLSQAAAWLQVCVDACVTRGGGGGSICKAHGGGRTPRQVGSCMHAHKCPVPACDNCNASWHWRDTTHCCRTYVRVLHPHPAPPNRHAHCTHTQTGPG
jgi:hypothetical protein